MDRLELSAVEVWQSCELVQTFISLVKASKEWTVQSLVIGANRMDLVDHGLLDDNEGNEGNDPPFTEESWTAMARKANCGQIGKLVLLMNLEETATAKEEDVKAVWEITEKLEVEFYKMSNEELVITNRYGGARGLDAKTTWEEVFQGGLNRICKP